jgi:hypothetical protein
VGLNKPSNRNAPPRRDNIFYSLLVARRRIAARYPDLFTVLTVSGVLVGLIVLANVFRLDELPSTPSHYTEGVHCERIQLYWRRFFSSHDKLVVFEELYRVERPLLQTPPWGREFAFRGPQPAPAIFDWPLQYRQLLIEYMRTHPRACERYSLEFFPRITSGIDCRLYDFTLGAH